MKVGTVAMSTPGRFNRMDARFALYAQEHLPVVDELLAKFTRDELVGLAGQLPYDHKAADACVTGYRTGDLRAAFRRWINYATTPADQVAVYVAAASEYGAGKLLAEIEQIQLDARRRLDELGKLITAVEAKDASLLMASIRKHTGDGG